MRTKKRLVCPDCGVEMNFHAEKVDQSQSAEGGVTEGEGMVVVEFHTCPRCGRTRQHKDDDQI